MSATVQARIRSDRSRWATPTAGTPGTERDTPQPVTAQVLGVVAEADGTYSDSVQHLVESPTRVGDEHGCDTPPEPHTGKETGSRKAEGLSRSARSAGSEAADSQALSEVERLARLRRWQGTP